MAVPHVADRTGPARRMPAERSRRERAQAADEPVEDTARILGLYWTVVPDGEPQAGLVVPFLLARWMSHFDPIPLMDIAEGDHASVVRSKDILDKLGVEAVQDDPHEHLICLQPSQVNHIQYLQNGYFTPRAGKPDFMWIDTMWDKLK